MPETQYPPASVKLFEDRIFFSLEGLVSGDAKEHNRRPFNIRCHDICYLPHFPDEEEVDWGITYRVCVPQQNVSIIFARLPGKEPGTLRDYLFGPFRDGYCRDENVVVSGMPKGNTLDRAEHWVKCFAETCRDMQEKGEMERALDQLGKITFYPEWICWNCHGEGVYEGLNVDYGAFFERASIVYCRSCENIIKNNTGEDPSLPPDGNFFLSIMRQRLIDTPHFLKTVHDYHSPLTQDNPCPSCSQTTYKFAKDLGCASFKDLKEWTVCINPECKWPGEFKSTYEDLYVDNFR